MEQTQAHTAVDQTEQALLNATEKMARAAHDTVDTLREYGERAETQLRSAGVQSREVMDQVSEYITAHPMAALGIAAAVGFVLGALAGRQTEADPT